MDSELVAAVMDDWRTAPISEQLRAVLEFLTVFVPAGGQFGADDIQKVRDAGVSDAAIVDALYVSFCFQNVSRWADTLDWTITSERENRLLANIVWFSGYNSGSIPPDVAWKGPAEPLRKTTELG